MMRKVLKMVAIAAVALAAWSCEPTPTEHPIEEPQVEVSLVTLEGIWQLDSWRGEPLAEGMYVYIDIARSGRTYTLYQNVNSFYTEVLTGVYNIYTDETTGATVIRGSYDHGAGDWNHRYVVESLTANTMRWVALDNSQEVNSYVRRQELPKELLGE